VEIQDGDEADTTFDVRELNIPMVKMTEVLAATMSREGLNTDVKSKLEEKLGKAFKQFVDNGGLYNEPGHAFFISKSSKVHSSTDLNAHLLRAIAKFNEHAASHLRSSSTWEDFALSSSAKSSRALTSVQPTPR